MELGVRAGCSGLKKPWLRRGIRFEGLGYRAQGRGVVGQGAGSRVRVSRQDRIIVSTIVSTQDNTQYSTQDSTQDRTQDRTQARAHNSTHDSPHDSTQDRIIVSTHDSTHDNTQDSTQDSTQESTTVRKTAPSEQLNERAVNRDRRLVRTFRPEFTYTSIAIPNGGTRVERLGTGSFNHP